MPQPSDAESDFPPVVLTFAASDPSGGAGIQADILTLASTACPPLSVLTAITVQDTLGVEALQPIDAGWVRSGAACSRTCRSMQAIGALAASKYRRAIAEIRLPGRSADLDPVLASRGDELANDEMLHALRELLLPRTTILTPNSMEARRLADVEDEEEPSLATCANRLIESGCEFVLITGTHEPTPQVVNTLYGKTGVVRSDSWQRLP
jgi:hydroxymethylpyrimidine/phosphomethylpyrimidine kinase